MKKLFYFFSILLLLTIPCQAKTEALATWISGSDTINQFGTYGTKGTADPCNIPGARGASISWTDSSGNLWLFGGAGTGLLNDLWKFDGAEWTWVSGSDGNNQTGVYGTKGTADPCNIPGARINSISWTDGSGNLWLFGGWNVGLAGSVDHFNDLWKFDLSTKMWTWVSGSDGTYQSGVYGTKGVADPCNVPGSRSSSISWTDSSDNLWLFGGYIPLAPSISSFNDLWKFDTAAEMWTWVSGSDDTYQAGVYGTKGVADPCNIPGIRHSSISWTDSSGNFWLFGGRGRDSLFNWGLLNDLWKFDGTNWTWISGSDEVEQPGVYGTKGTADPYNIPGARIAGISWTDGSGNFWLFGGYGYTSDWSRFNDLWKFDGAEWAWVSGSDEIEQAGLYGTKGTADPCNIPGARHSSISWTDTNNLWLFGGDGIDSAGGTGSLNDLWKFEIIYDIYYVDGSATGSDNGTSWTNAFNDLEDALDAARPGDEIWVAERTYYPTTEAGGSGPRYQAFQMKNGVAILGGYAGYGAADPNERNIELYETILSGDLLANDVPVDDPCDLKNDPYRADNCYHVFYHRDENLTLETTAILDGFTITAGNANGPNHNYGGGMANFSSNPTVTNCTFTANSADNGGGMFNDHSDPIVTNCTFSNNLAYNGGGMLNYLSNPIVTGCTFTANSDIETFFSAEQGGAGMLNHTSSPTVTDCTFSANSANYGGGMLSWIGSSPTVTDCSFIGNIVVNGGGGMCNWMDSSPIVTSCTFTANLADYDGGGMSNLASSPTVTNCTFTANEAGSGGGGMFNLQSGSTVTNCIFWNNTAVNGNEISNYFFSTPTISYCDVQGGLADIYNDGSTVNWLSGNIDIDPCFADPCDGDFHLKSQGWRWDKGRQVWTWDDVTSRCIDAGNSGSPLSDELLTIPSDPTNEYGQNIRINMGAYGGTAQASMPPYDWALLADLTNDGIVNLIDFATQADDWLQSDTAQFGDLDRDGTVSFTDLLLTAQDWLKQTIWY